MTRTLLRFGALLPLLILASACSYLPTDRAPQLGFDYDVTVVNNPNEQRFDLTLTSRSRFNICFGHSDRPTSVGAMEAIPERLWVEHSETRFEMGPIDMGYCIGSCYAVRLKPAAQATAFLQYSRFDGLDPATAKDSTLHFRPRGHWCRIN